MTVPVRLTAEGRTPNGTRSWPHNPSETWWRTGPIITMAAPMSRAKASQALRRARSGAIDQHELAVVERDKGELPLVLDGRAVARVDADTVDAERSPRRHEIGVAARAERIFD